MLYKKFILSSFPLKLINLTIINSSNLLFFLKTSKSASSIVFSLFCILAVEPLFSNNFLSFFLTNLFFKSMNSFSRDSHVFCGLSKLSFFLSNKAFGEKFSFLNLRYFYFYTSFLNKGSIFLKFERVLLN